MTKQKKFFGNITLSFAHHVILWHTMQISDIVIDN
jgi:hypothetical protein